MRSLIRIERLVERSYRTVAIKRMLTALDERVNVRVEQLSFITQRRSYCSHPEDPNAAVPPIDDNITLKPDESFSAAVSVQTDQATNNIAVEARMNAATCGDGSESRIVRSPGLANRRLRKRREADAASGSKIACSR